MPIATTALVAALLVAQAGAAGRVPSDARAEPRRFGDILAAAARATGDVYFTTAAHGNLDRAPRLPAPEAGEPERFANWLDGELERLGLAQIERQLGPTRVHALVPIARDRELSSELTVRPRLVDRAQLLALADRTTPVVRVRSVWPLDAEKLEESLRVASEGAAGRLVRPVPAADALVILGTAKSVAKVEREIDALLPASARAEIDVPPAPPPSSRRRPPATARAVDLEGDGTARPLSKLLDALAPAIGEPVAYDPEAARDGTVCFVGCARVEPERALDWLDVVVADAGGRRIERPAGSACIHDLLFFRLHDNRWAIPAARWVPVDDLADLGDETVSTAVELHRMSARDAAETVCTLSRDSGHESSRGIEGTRIVLLTGRASTVVTAVRLLRAVDARAAPGRMR